MKNDNETVLEKYQQRIEELEIKSAFQEDQLNTLNEIVARQENDIQKLWEASKILNARLKSAELGSESSDQSNQPPPHY